MPVKFFFDSINNVVFDDDVIDELNRDFDKMKFFRLSNEKW